MTIIEVLQNAKAAAPALALLKTEDKNRALMAMAEALITNMQKILIANTEDLAQAETNGMNQVMTDRLRLTEERIEGMAKGIREVVELSDPVGRVTDRVVRPNGLVIEKTRVPMGVVAIIYESRPNVTSDAAALSLKSGNVCVLRGGKEAFRSSQAIISALRSGLAKEGFNENFVNMVPDTSREGANQLMTAVEYVDLLIPRGGAGLIRACVENAKVPCIQTGTGICHVYVDADADIEKALDILENAKTSRPSVCNAAEVCLIHREIAPKLLPLLKKRLCDDRAEKGLTPVELRLDGEAAQWIEGTPAGEADFDTEFLNYILAVKVVKNLHDAITHISAHSTHHSEAILTNTPENAALFTAAIDSAAVYVNASTRFTDGGEFGLGCEIGISTQKLHARGPMGLEELTTYKYVIRGNGQIR
ncbi:MAG: glutamate-5-semialdehyde dehydrogenase [Ruminococcaceae bacterium]|nr:glutamate-5-semialdehyde dehydrogenase [Oscillospiraceae bacterium]